MLVVLERLGPAERVAFVLHDMFAVPFDEIAPVLGRTTVATKKLASRARQRVRGARPPEVAEQKEIVEAFLKASREGDLDALLGILAPDVVRTADAAALPKGRSTLVRGRDAVAREMLVLGRRARFAEPALVDGKSGAVVAPNGQLRLVLAIEIRDGLVAGYEVIATPERLQVVEISAL
jgi:RNA polymerase sigma-70 factor (ECF subfamily)